MTYFNTQTFLTPCEHIITYFWKFSSRIFQYCAGSLTASAWLTHCQPYRHAYGTLHRLSHTDHLNLLVATDMWCTV